MSDIPLLPGEVVKASAPRGPLRQYRLAAATHFDCSRCGGLKTSKLITVVDGRSDRLLCNGCYGWLLSLWEIKSGSLPDADRDAAILALLRQSVSPDQIEAARARLGERALHRRLCPEAQQVLATADAVTVVLRGATGLDWSAAVIGLCKAVEIEVVRRVAEPLRAKTAGVDLTADAADKDLGRLARYCLGKAPPPELGSLAYTLEVAARSRRRTSTSPLLRSLRELVDSWPGGEWIVSADGLCVVAGELSRGFRNPAAHTSVLVESDFVRCRELVQGEGGVLDRLVSATA